MKRFKFNLGAGAYIYYFGHTLGEAIKAFIDHRPNRLDEVETITEEPIKDHELP